ncbi:putative interleukin-17 receptor E-like [Monodelphis domestica]|uniref:putative interleukin-17 receptor E-like n=1 Tax=Monodelphis domestica TaxID=13616 RepID=UPI0024E1ED5B|nr:putative interleukin-17 receptor E-like [Monodelphis domestica]
MLSGSAILFLILLGGPREVQTISQVAECGFACSELSNPSYHLWLRVPEALAAASVVPTAYCLVNCTPPPPLCSRSPGVACKNKVNRNIFNSFCRHPSPLVTPSILESLTLSTAIKCVQRGTCSLHLSVSASLVMEESVRGLEICLLSLDTQETRCHSTRIPRVASRKMVGRMLQVHFDCFEVNVAQHVYVTLKTVPYYCEVQISREYHVEGQLPGIVPQTADCRGTWLAPGGVERTSLRSAVTQETSLSYCTNADVGRSIPACFGCRGIFRSCLPGSSPKVLDQGRWCSSAAAAGSKRTQAPASPHCAPTRVLRWQGGQSPSRDGAPRPGLWGQPSLEGVALHPYLLSLPAGGLHYAVDPAQKAIRVRFAEVSKGQAYYVRLCLKWFSCEDHSPPVLVLAEQPGAEVSLKYSRLLPCLCIEGWAAVPDAVRVQICPFENDTLVLWDYVVYNPFTGALSWEPPCPVQGHVHLCGMSEMGDKCWELSNTNRSIPGNVHYLQVDPQPWLCMKFTTPQGSWVRCPFATGNFPGNCLARRPSLPLPRVGQPRRILPPSGQLGSSLRGLGRRRAVLRRA